MPSAPSTQLMGARLAPAQIQNWPETLCVRCDSGMGWSQASQSSVGIIAESCCGVERLLCMGGASMSKRDRSRLCGSGHNHHIQCVMKICLPCDGVSCPYD